MRGFGLQRQRPVADQLRIAAVLLRKIGRWMPQYAKGKVTRSKCFFLVLHNPVCLNILPSVYIMKEKRTVI